MNPDSLLQQYESGRLSRRELLGALAVLVAAPATATTAHAAQAGPIGAIRQMNHVSIFVPSVQKSVDFYQGLFGMPLLTRQDPGTNLSASAGFLGIYPAQAGATAASRPTSACAGTRKSCISRIRTKFACNYRTSSTRAARVRWATKIRSGRGWNDGFCGKIRLPILGGGLNGWSRISTA